MKYTVHLSWLESSACSRLSIDYFFAQLYFSPFIMFIALPIFPYQFQLHFQFMSTQMKSVISPPNRPNLHFSNSKCSERHFQQQCMCIKWQPVIGGFREPTEDSPSIPFRCPSVTFRCSSLGEGLGEGSCTNSTTSACKETTIENRKTDRERVQDVYQFIRFHNPHLLQKTRISLKEKIHKIALLNHVNTYFHCLF